MHSGHCPSSPDRESSKSSLCPHSIHEVEFVLELIKVSEFFQSTIAKIDTCQSSEIGPTRNLLIQYINRAASRSGLVSGPRLSLRINSVIADRYSQ